MSGYLATLNPTEADFETIRLAVMETERGRWFLDEYAKRNRHSDTDSILTAMQRIEGVIRHQRESSEMDKFRLDVLEMSRAIARTRDEISAIKPTDGTGGRLTEATDELDSIVAATETATSDILASAEKVQEAAWTLRENGAESEICEKLDELATGIYTSCSFQDLTAQRIRRVIATIDFLEKRVNAMADIWQLSDEEKSAYTPDVDSNAGLAIDPAMSQADVDFVLVSTLDKNSMDAHQTAQDLADNVTYDPIVADAQISDFELDMAFASGQPDEPLKSQEVELCQSAELTSTADQQSQAIDEILFSQSAVSQQAFEHHSPDESFDVEEPLFAVIDPAVDGAIIADADTQEVAHIEAAQIEAAQIEAALAKIRSGGELSFAEAAKALDQLKNMSAEDRSHLFRG